MEEIFKVLAWIWVCWYNIGCQTVMIVYLVLKRGYMQQETEKKSAESISWMALGEENKKRRYINRGKANGHAENILGSEAGWQCLFFVCLWAVDWTNMRACWIEFLLEVGCLFFFTLDTLLERTGFEAFRWNGLLERSSSDRTADQNGLVGWRYLLFFPSCYCWERFVKYKTTPGKRYLNFLVDTPQKSGLKSWL